jgi:hypothetical protein
VAAVGEVARQDDVGVEQRRAESAIGSDRSSPSTSTVKKPVIAPPAAAGATRSRSRGIAANTLGG